MMATIAAIPGGLGLLLLGCGILWFSFLALVGYGFKVLGTWIDRRNGEQQS